MATIKSERQQYIDMILQDNGDEDNVQERAFLQTLELEELKNLIVDNKDEINDDNDIG
jgi:hypothetical protein